MSEKYNILLMISDQHSKYHIGAYGDPLVRTPHLDQLAESGLRLTSAYCASPVCVPSRMSFMTCRTPSANRVWNNNHLLHSGIPTWAHAMGLAGYETSLIGRMHFNGHDQRHGFENRPLGEYGATHPGANRQGAPLFKSISTATTGQNRTAVEIAGRGYGSYHVFDEMVAEKTSAYLRDKAKNPGKHPFAAVAGFLLPHCPFIAHKELTTTASISPNTRPMNLDLFANSNSFAASIPPSTRNASALPAPLILACANISTSKSDASFKPCERRVSTAIPWSFIALTTAKWPGNTAAGGKAVTTKDRSASPSSQASPV